MLSDYCLMLSCVPADRDSFVCVGSYSRKQNKTSGPPEEYAAEAAANGSGAAAQAADKGKGKGKAPAAAEAAGNGKSSTAAAAAPSR